MWLRNLLIYRFTQPFALDQEALNEALAKKPARPCASQELTTYGFTPPLAKSESGIFAHAEGDFLLIATRKEERILPASVIRNELKAKIDEIEATQMRKVYRKEKDQIKDELVMALLPRAFTRQAVCFAVIMPKDGMIIVDSASVKSAEDLLSTLREAIGSLPVRPVSVKVAPTSTMTVWLKTQQAAKDFTVLDECELRDTHEDGGIVRCKRQDLSSDEIQHHMSAGKQATKLSLAWQDKLSFGLDERLTITRLRFDDLLQDQAEQDGGDDDLDQLRASFLLCMLTLRQFIPALLEALGGEEIPQAA